MNTQALHRYTPYTRKDQNRFANTCSMCSRCKLAAGWRDEDFDSDGEKIADDMPDREDDGEIDTSRDLYFARSKEA